MSKEFAIGSKVRVVALPPYVKTADPMPMLRPPDVINLGEEGIVLDRRPGGYWGIRFTRGAFLLDSQYIESTDIPSESDQGDNNSNQEL
ncbi:hypothetical protein NIES21_11850 [Anabaenopsis circularis NIES-21]|uniref:Uncharacterized protein n=2 Tax=Nostocales TaxID=1161 RepID=A0A1Z4GDH9_9CYAN|nr:DUF3148 domain-containing protein [Nostoc cycadae]BAY15368.1 hypothetical protein NIES21_11850 [Anabaenopsis circularis NIES-21]GBE93277.1 hypothetical protein NCWK1_3039 [Nostoc cycadae WK-1]